MTASFPPRPGFFGRAQSGTGRWERQRGCLRTPAAHQRCSLAGKGSPATGRSSAGSGRCQTHPSHLCAFHSSRRRAEASRSGSVPNLRSAGAPCAIRARPRYSDGDLAATPAFVPGGKRRAELGWGCNRQKRKRVGEPGAARPSAWPGPSRKPALRPNTRISHPQGHPRAFDPGPPAPRAASRGFRAEALSHATHSANAPRGWAARGATAAARGQKGALALFLRARDEEGLRRLVHPNPEIPLPYLLDGGGSRLEFSLFFFFFF